MQNISIHVFTASQFLLYQKREKISNSYIKKDLQGSALNILSIKPAQYLSKNNDKSHFTKKNASQVLKNHF